MDNQSRETGNIWHKTLTKDEQNNEYNTETDEQHGSYQKKYIYPVVNSGIIQVIQPESFCVYKNIWSRYIIN